MPPTMYLPRSEDCRHACIYVHLQSWSDGIVVSDHTFSNTEGTFRRWVVLALAHTPAGVEEWVDRIVREDGIQATFPSLSLER
jgi:hypothetical protein